MTDQQQRARAVLDAAGETYARRAGIRLADTPQPLYQLLVVSVLLSARINADVALAAARELFADGLTTPSTMRDASWQHRVDALGRGHYRRYDESTSTRLGDGAQLVLDRWDGDLRRLAEESGKDPGRAAELLQEVPGIGPLGASIFLREVQAVWPWLRPYVDERVLEDARALGLPHTTRALAAVAGTDDLSALTAAVARVRRDKSLREKVEGAT